MTTNLTDLYRESNAFLAAELGEEPPVSTKPEPELPQGKRPMTSGEREAAKILKPGLVTYLPGSWDKRFAESMYALSGQEQPVVSEKQAECLARLARRYRGQAPGAAQALRRRSRGD